MMNTIENKVVGGKRLSFDEGVSLFQGGDLIRLGLFADYIKRIKHPQRIVTYIIDRNINYTNICTSRCKFCAFSVTPSSRMGYLLSRQELAKKIEETVSSGGIQILMQGGLHPDLKIEYYEGLLRFIKSDFPQVHIHAFSAPEIVNISEISRLSLQATIIRLKEAGLDSIPGGGAEILVDKIRKRISPHKYSAGKWLEVMRTAHRLGIRTTATMMFGSIETEGDRISHLIKIRELQDETGGFTAFIPWTFQPGNTRLPLDPTTAADYLRTLAISRIMLDNVDNLQASWVTQGAKIAQLSLEFGANDFGSTMIEENVVKSAGISFRMSEEDIARCIEEAGYCPRRRSMNYQILGEPLCRKSP